jgi:RHS repeat-associated protein
LYNHTGYAQVLEERPAAGAPSVTYIIGDDVIARFNLTMPRYYLCDGQGSVRHYTGGTGGLILYGYTGGSCDTFAYDAYGQRVDPLKDTVNNGSFYTGQQWDKKAKMYYLRARYYDPLTGRFNRIDPFEGNYNDPQSLHKYLYCHANPINNLDPSGQQTTFAEVIHIAAIGLRIYSALMLAYNVGRIIYLTATEQMTIDRAMWEIAKMGLEMAAWWVGGWLVGKIIQFGSVPLSKLPQIFQRVNRNRIVGKWAERVWGAAKGLQRNNTIINGTKPDFIQGNTLHELKYYVKSKITLSPQLERMTKAGKEVVLHVTPVTKVVENVKKAIELTGGTIVRDLPLLEFETLAAAGYITDRSFEDSNPEDYWP